MKRKQKTEIEIIYLKKKQKQKKKRRTDNCSLFVVSFEWSVYAYSMTAIVFDILIEFKEEIFRA